MKCFKIMINSPLSIQNQITENIPHIHFDQSHSSSTGPKSTRVSNDSISFDFEDYLSGLPSPHIKEGGLRREVSSETLSIAEAIVELSSPIVSRVGRGMTPPSITSNSSSKVTNDKVKKKKKSMKKVGLNLVDSVNARSTVTRSKKKKRKREEEEEEEKDDFHFEDEDDQELTTKITSSNVFTFDPSDLKRLSTSSSSTSSSTESTNSTSNPKSQVLFLAFLLSFSLGVCC